MPEKRTQEPEPEGDAASQRDTKDKDDEAWDEHEPDSDYVSEPDSEDYRRMQEQMFQEEKENEDRYTDNVGPDDQNDDEGENEDILFFALLKSLEKK